MNKVFKLTYLALVGVMASLLNACTNDFSYDGAGSDDTLASYGNIYFPTKSYSVELDPTDPTTYTIEIMRSDATSAVSVPITVEGDDASVVTASTAEFAADQTETTVTLSFPNAAIGTTYTVTLGAQGATYLDPCTFSFTRVKWNDVGYYYDSKGNKVEGWCNFTEDFLTTFFGISNYTYPVKVQERDDKPNYYRVLNVYGETCPLMGDEDYDATQTSYLYIDATDSTKVYIPSACNTHANVGYGDIYLHSLAGYYIANGDAASAEGLYGTKKNGKITFPAKSLLVGMTNYNSGGLYYANNNGAFCLSLDPDLDIYEASFPDDFEFDEVYTGAYKSALLNTETESTLYKGTCIETKDDCDKTFAEEYGTAYAIESPYAEDYHIYFAAKDGKITLPITDPQPIGIKALTEDVYATINAGASSFTDKVVTLNITFTNADGTIDYGTFNETLSNITWTQTTTGTYTYLSTMWNIGSERGLALNKRDDTDNTYKISNWLMGSTDLVFTWDKTTNKCEVQNQFTGYTHSKYGDMYIIELNQYASDTADQESSYYDPATKTFHFNIIYYVSQGYFAYGFETFALDAASAAKAHKAKPSAKISMKKATLKKDMKHTYNLKGVRGRFARMKDVSNVKHI